MRANTMNAARLAAGLLGVASLGVAARSEAAVSKPFPGVTLVRNGGRALAVADLCAPGVSIRATKYEERRRTPESWAGVAGVDVAVNADFFDFPAATLVFGRARGAGQDWPANKQWYEYSALGEVRSYWQFGPGLAALVQPSTNAPSAQATEIVGAHNVIIRDGKSLAPGFDGDGVVLSAVRRTAIGVDAKREHVYLFASNDALSGAAMASTMIAYATEAGAPPIDVASNEDGGGSSQMFVRGLGQIVTSGRLVANHLGIVAKGSGASPMCPNRAPTGYLDSVACESLVGWAQDPDAPSSAIDVRFTFDGAEGAPSSGAFEAKASRKREDLCAAIGSCDHGFDVPTPYGLFDGKEHTVHAYGVDAKGGAASLLGSAPKKLTCAASLPPGVRRAVAEASALGWKIDPFRDVIAGAPAELEGLAVGEALSASPRLVRGDDGSPEVWLADGASKRHVTNPESAALWHFDLNAVAVEPAATLRAMKRGADLASRPTFARDAGGKLWLIDVPPGGPGADDPHGTPGGTEGEAAGGPESSDEGGGCHAASQSGRGAGELGSAILGAIAAAGVVRARRRKERRTARK